jgi:malonate transporter MadL subunit
MVILGTLLLAACYLAGIGLGELLGQWIGVKANVGGVGFAMLLLILTQTVLHRHGWVKPDTERGVTFWAAMYIPVMVAMSATQNVLVAFRSSGAAVIGAAGSFALCALAIAAINRWLVPAGAAAEWNERLASAEVAKN